MYTYEFKENPIQGGKPFIWLRMWFVFDGTKCYCFFNEAECFDNYLLMKESTDAWIFSRLILLDYKSPLYDSVMSFHQSKSLIDVSSSPIDSESIL